MYIEITPTDYIVSFRRQTDKPTAFNVDYHYSEDPDYQSGIIDFTQLKQDLVVSIHLENGVWVADHTYDDMAQAIANGVLVRLTDETNDRYAIVGGYTDDSYIFVTNDTDYCYAYIVTDADAWTMEEVLEGEDGVGIASVTFNPDYTLTLTLTNGDTYTSQSLRGASGPAGADGADGQDGADGVGISSTVLNADYTLTITLTDGSSYTTPSIRGAQGPEGPEGPEGQTGATGNGIASITLNADYTLTIVYTNGQSTTTTSIRGAQGPQGPSGPGVPAGGSAGQVLAKVDGTNYNTEWVTPSAPSVGALDTTSATALPTSASESFGGNISLHKISKTGDYGDLLNKPTIPAAQVNSDWNAVSGVAQILNKPTIPAAPGTLDTTQTTAQTTSANEALSGNVKLHKVSKTGDYGDLLNKPTIPAAQVNSDWSAVSGVAEILNKPAIPTKTSDLSNDSGFLTSANAVTSFNNQTGAVTYSAPVTSVNGSTGAVTGLEVTSNKVTSIDGSSTDTQYPSAKLLYDQLATKQDTVSAGVGIDVTTNIISNTMSIEYIVGTQAAATNAWTGVTKEASLKTGKVIAYYLPYAGTSSAATLNLTLSGGGTTGAKSIRRQGSSTVTTHFAANNVLVMIYDGTYWKVSGYYYTDSNTIPTGYCTTAAATAAKSASCTYGYRDDATYFPCVFRYANTANNATLAISSYATTALPIYVNGARTSSSNTFGNGVILFLYYNSAYYCYNDGRFPIVYNGAVTSVQDLAATFQTTANLVTSIDANSTDTQYPSAKCMYDLCGDIETLINAL